MNRFKDIFQAYEALAAGADRVFAKIQKEYGSCVKCDVRCSDCCHSVFGLFLIESLYLNHHFSKLDWRLRREALARGDRADRDLLEMEKKLQAYDSDPRLKARAMARERIRCPLLDDEGKCLLYAHRPITCRVYGIPSIINGEARACWKAGFEEGQPYPAFNLDGAYRELHRLSGELLERAGEKDGERAALLLSVSSSIKTPAEELIGEK